MARDLWIPAAVAFDADQPPDAPTLRVTARILEFGAVNLKGNIAGRDAFPERSPVQVSDYAHSSMGGMPPIGAGAAIAGPTHLDAEVEINLGMDRGREVASMLRFNADRGIRTEWSYGFDILDAKPKDPERPYEGLELLKVQPREVSPVYTGANEASRTMGLDSARYRELAGGLEIARDEALDAAMAQASAEILTRLMPGYGE